MSYKYLNNVLELINIRINEVVKSDSIVLDATLGNGNDTYKLLNILDSNGKLYGFDIQKEALNNTRQKIEKIKNLASKDYRLILDSHENLDRYINYKLDYVIYNLGYLPGGDKSITTLAESTIKSVKKSMDLLNNNGLINIVVYHGHAQGKDEKRSIEAFLKEINQDKYHILKHEFINQKNNPPILYEIEKKNN